MAVKSQKIRLGTRGSPLALTQTEMVRAALAKAFPELETEVVIIKTSGDWDPKQGETRLQESAGGKGQFAKEIEEALLARTIDAGIHSMKDMESRLPEGLIIDHMLPREAARDAIIFRELADNAHSLDALPQGFVIGTSSVRRQAFLLQKRPDLKIVPLRGNVHTRLEKLARAEQGMQAIILAYAGLKRLGLADKAHMIVEPEDMLPSAGQGAVGIEILQDNQDCVSIFSQISCSKTVLCVKAERAALAVLDGSCSTPVGAHAVIKEKEMHLQVRLVSPDGKESYFRETKKVVSSISEAEELGRSIGEQIRAEVPDSLLRP